MIDSSSRSPLPQSQGPRKEAGLTTAPVSRAGRPAVEPVAANRWRGKKSSAERSESLEGDARRGDRANVIYKGGDGGGVGGGGGGFSAAAARESKRSAGCGRREVAAMACNRRCKQQRYYADDKQMLMRDLKCCRDKNKRCHSK